MSELPPKLVRIFISSPRDVAEERKLAAELIEQELAKREAFHETLKLLAFRYDDSNSDTPFLADRSAQGSVDQRLRSADAEIVVAILWARMGTPVPIGTTLPKFSTSRAPSKKSRRRSWRAAKCWSISGADRRRCPMTMTRSPKSCRSGRRSGHFARGSSSKAAV